MTDYLAGLVARAMVSTTDVQPRVTPLFGPAQPGAVEPLPEAGPYVDDPGVEVDLAFPGESRPAISRSHTGDNVVAHVNDAPAPAEIRTFQPPDRPSRGSAGERHALPPSPSSPTLSIPPHDVSPAANRASIIETVTHGSTVAAKAPRPNARIVTASAEPPVIRRRTAQPQTEVRKRPDSSSVAVRESSSRALIRGDSVAPVPSLRQPRIESSHETRPPQGRQMEAKGAPHEVAARNIRVSPLEEAHRTIQSHGAVVPVPAMVERPRQTVTGKERAAQESSAARTVQVTIGRLEVRVATSAPTRRAPRNQQPSMSLEEYVRSRNKGGAQ